MHRMMLREKIAVMTAPASTSHLTKVLRPRKVEANRQRRGRGPVARWAQAEVVDAVVADADGWLPEIVACEAGADGIANVDLHLHTIDRLPARAALAPIHRMSVSVRSVVTVMFRRKSVL
jgi:hypothetical protein